MQSLRQTNHPTGFTIEFNLEEFNSHIEQAKPSFTCSWLENVS